jgi:hypothetical protein
LRHAVHEALGMRDVRRDQDDASAILAALLGAAVVDVVGCVQPDAAVMVLAVVPGEEIDAVRARVLDAAEALGEVRAVLQRFESSLGKRVVVGSSTSSRGRPCRCPRRSDPASRHGITITTARRRARQSARLGRVTAYRLVAEHTVEQKILTLQDHKRALFASSRRPICADCWSDVPGTIAGAQRPVHPGTSQRAGNGVNPAAAKSLRSNVNASVSSIACMRANDVQSVNENTSSA